MFSLRMRGPVREAVKAATAFHVEWLLSLAVLIISTFSSGAFTLLGPVQPWMQMSNGVITAADLGGPMPLGSGYRWNVPVVTYGYDQSFLSFFGSNGVAAVEGALQILNDLPPASQIVLSNYPLSSLYENFAAQSQSLVDLKSQVLVDLLPQMGLTSPRRYTYVLHDLDTNFFADGLDWGDTVYGMPLNYVVLEWYQGPPIFNEGAITNYVAGFNYDPETLMQSIYVNEAGFAGLMVKFDNGAVARLIQPYAVDPIGNQPPAIADENYLTLSMGSFITGLTRDDVGGLRYLLSSNNVAYETLLGGVGGITTNSFVNGALRPGIEKLTFVAQTSGVTPGTFVPMTNQFSDTYITNSIVIQQQLQRVTTQPDFLFSAGNDAFGTGTTNWINHGGVNSSATGSGPGNIRPGIVIVLPKLGRVFANTSGQSEESAQEFTSDEGIYGSFDGSTNAPIVYPASQTGSVAMTLRLMLSNPALEPLSHSLQWTVTNQIGSVYTLQTTTNLLTWTTLFQITNNGSLTTYFNDFANNSARFYRLFSQ